MSQRAPTAGRPASGLLEMGRTVVLSPLGIAFFTAACLVAADLRRFAEVEPGYGFLRWNLFLAWIPLVLAYAISWAARREAAWPAIPLLGLVWIVFLPNAPYLVTDLVHLREVVNVPNAVVLMLLAFTGLLIGVKAVQLVQRAVEHVFGPAAGWRVVQVIVMLTAFGVYLGRELRWNSWTLISHPQRIEHAILRSAHDPGRVGLGMLGTIVFASAFYLAYRVLTGARRSTALSPDSPAPATRP